MTAKDFKVGQTVYIIIDFEKSAERWNINTAKVVSVGRKYVYAQSVRGGRKIQFAPCEDPRFWRENCNVYPHWLFASKDAIEECTEERKLRKMVHGVLSSYHRIESLTLPQLRKIKQIFDMDNGEEGGSRYGVN